MRAWAGVRVSLDFFEDIFVPANNLPTPHEFQEGSDGSDGAEASENTWVWKYEGENMCVTGLHRAGPIRGCTRALGQPMLDCRMASSLMRWQCRGWCLSGLAAGT